MLRTNLQFFKRHSNNYINSAYFCNILPIGRSRSAIFSSVFLSQIHSYSKENFIIQLALKNDIRELAKIAKKTYEETYPGYFTSMELEKLFGGGYINNILPTQLNNKNNFFPLIKYNDKVIGYAKLTMQDNEYALLDKLYLLKNYQGKGYGYSLLQYCYQLAYEKNRFKMKLSVYDKNEKAIVFYEKHGFLKEFEKVPYRLPDGSFSGDYDNIMICKDIRNYMASQNKSYPDRGYRR